MECSLFYVSILEMVAVVAESQVLLSSSSICLSEIYDKTKVNKRSFSRWLPNRARLGKLGPVRRGPRALAPAGTLHSKISQLSGWRRADTDQRPATAKELGEQNNDHRWGWGLCMRAPVVSINRTGTHITPGLCPIARASLTFCSFIRATA